MGKGSGGIWVLRAWGVLVAEAVEELGKGTKGSRGSLKECFNLASKGEVVGGVVLDELINHFIEAAEVSHLRVGHLRVFVGGVGGIAVHGLHVVSGRLVGPWGRGGGGGRQEGGAVFRGERRSAVNRAWFLGCGAFVVAKGGGGWGGWPL